MNSQRNVDVIRHKELKKHAAAIHSSATLTLLQRKISNALLFYAYPELQEKEEHKITIRELCHIIGYQGNNHSVIKDALKGLVATVIEWNLVNDQCQEEDWTASTIVASVRLKGPDCYYAYSPRMKELLYSPSVYGKINLIVQSKFRSTYGLALYENCVRYKGLPQTKWFDFHVFRHLMGVPDGKYPIYRDFKKRVLDKSLQEVNMFSDLVVEPEVKRTRRQVSQIRFKIDTRQRKQRIGHTHDTESSLTASQENLIQILVKSYGFTKTQALDLLNDFGENKIGEKLNLVESSSNYQKGKIQNLAAYFLSALRENYQVTSSQKTRDREYLEKERQLLTIRTQQKQEENLKANYQRYIADFIESRYQSLPISEKESINEAFVKGLTCQNNDMILSLFHRDGFKNAIVKGVFRGFIREHYPHLINELLTYEAFVENPSFLNKPSNTSIL